MWGPIPKIVEPKPTKQVSDAIVKDGKVVVSFANEPFEITTPEEFHWLLWKKFEGHLPPTELCVQLHDIFPIANLRKSSMFDLIDTDVRTYTIPNYDWDP